MSFTEMVNGGNLGSKMTTISDSKSLSIHSGNISIEYNDNIQRKIKLPSSAIRILNTQAKYKYKQRDESIEIIISGLSLNNFISNTFSPHYYLSLYNYDFLVF